MKERRQAIKLKASVLLCLLSGVFLSAGLLMLCAYDMATGGDDFQYTGWAVVFTRIGPPTFLFGLMLGCVGVIGAVAAWSHDYTHVDLSIRSYKLIGCGFATMVAACVACCLCSPEGDMIASPVHWRHFLYVCAGTAVVFTTLMGYVFACKAWRVPEASLAAAQTGRKP